MTDSEKTDQLPASMDVAQLVPALSGSGLRGRFREWLHRLLGVHSVYRVFGKARDVQDDGGENVFLSVLREQKMSVDLGDLRSRIPKSGSLVVVANHPFGGADAIALTGVCAGCRPDTKILANAMISDLPGTRNLTIPLQIMGEDNALEMNRHSLKASLDHLRNGGLLVVFPAGAVSRWRNDLAKVSDPEWSPHIARLASKTSSPVLPVKFFGKNPVWFQILGSIHPIIRSVLILRVFLSMKGKTIVCRAGRMLQPVTLDAEDATDLIRNAVESLEDPT